MVNGVNVVNSINVANGFNVANSINVVNVSAIHIDHINPLTTFIKLATFNKGSATCFFSDDLSIFSPRIAVSN